MSKHLPLFISLFISALVSAQTPERITISSITPSEYTGQDYSPWLNDDLNSLVQFTWGNNDPNKKYVDVSLRLAKKVRLSKVSLYDHQGVFPAGQYTYIFAVNGTDTTSIGTFNGSSYMAFIDYPTDTSVIAESIVIRKYANDIPQKVRVYGYPVPDIEERIGVTSITPSEPGIQDFTPWITDDLNSFVQPTWGNNDPYNKYIDVNLKLAKHIELSRVSLYDYQGTIPANQITYIYALNGNDTTALGTFNGSSYMAFVNLKPNSTTYADAIVVRKFRNDMPHKVWIYGFPTGVTTAKQASVITFNPIPNKTTADAPFTLQANSTNTQTSITFQSSNPSIISVSNASGIWKASILSEGTVTITASQAGNGSYLDAVNVSRQVVIHKASGVITSPKIPLDWKRWYHVNSNNIHFDMLTDGIASNEISTIREGKILQVYDSYYPLRQGESMSIDAIRFYDGFGMDTNHPFKLSVITDTWQRIQIATFTGEHYLSWVGPYPGRTNEFLLDTVISNARYLVITADGLFPTEMELYGNYMAGTIPSQAVKKPVKLRDMFAVNAFEWDFENLAIEIDTAKLKAAKSFTGIRHYMDWEKLESEEGKYTFNPTRSGGWDYDSMYETCKAEGIEVLACIKTIPAWLQASYPAEIRDAENVPARHGSDLLNPASYIEQAKCAFQFAARYGSNKNISPTLLSVNSTPRWNFDPLNVVKVGLNLVKYFECDNERDKSWKGRQGYQTGREYAANLSAFYDGHKNTMGPGVGVKNADPNMKVVMCGIASVQTDYVEAMVDWCREFRGYNPDGTVNICWDVVNYHAYSNDAQSSQDGRNTRGAAPEVGGLAKVADEFVQMSHEISNNVEVWVTETGYDINQGSTLKAIPIGNKSAEEVQAEWILRTSLLYSRHGVTRCFFYQMYDGNVNYDIVFQSSGLIRGHDLSRKPAADYLYQTNKLFGEYVYKETLNIDPIVARYELNGKSMYSLFVPDEKGRTANYTLSLGSADSAYIYKPQIGSDNMSLEKVKLTSGQLPLLVTEMPVFVMGITTRQNNSYTWTGTMSTETDKPGNWANTITGSTTEVPDEKSTILIPGGLSRYPILSSVFSAKNITIAAGASLNLNGYELTISGNLTNKGSLLSASKATSTLIFNRTDSIQIFRGNTLNSSSTGRLILNNPNGMLLQDGQLEVYDYLKIYKGSLNANGYLTLKATAESFASIASLPIGSSVLGDVTVEAYLSGGSIESRSLRMISSPINDNLITGAKSLEQLKKYTIITGPGGAANGFDTGSSSQPYLPTLTRYYEPASPVAPQFSNVNAINEAFTPGSGMLLFYRGDRSGYTPETAATSLKLNPPYAVPENTIVKYTGPINQGNVSANLSYTYHEGDPKNGYNLLGNPYPCAISWKKITKNEVADQYMILKPDGSYATYSQGVTSNAGQIDMRFIQPGQGFYIQAYSSPNRSLTFTEACKVIGKVFTGRLASTNQAELTGFEPVDRSSVQVDKKSLVRVLLTDEKLSEETVIAFETGKQATFSTQDGDACYFGNGALSLSSLTEEGDNATINFMPQIDSVKSVRLNINSSRPVSPVLRFTEVSNLENSTLWLRDKLLNKNTLITKGTEYRFSIDKSNPATYGPNRFVILSSSITENWPGTGFSGNVKIYPNPAESSLYIELDERFKAASISIYDTSGRLVKSQIANSTLTLIDIKDMPSNTYIVLARNINTKELISKTKFIKR